MAFEDITDLGAVRQAIEEFRALGQHGFLPWGCRTPAEARDSMEAVTAHAAA